MHLLFLHQNFPAQFGPVLSRLAALPGIRCAFVSRTGHENIPGVVRIPYTLRGGATARGNYFSRTFENVAWNSQAVFEALRARPDIRPDVIVAHSGFLSALPLRQLYRAPIVNYFEFYYRAEHSDIDFRPDAPPTDEDRIRARFRNAAILLDLENCDRGWSPTHWQRDRLPAAYRPKVRVVFDGVDTALWRPRPRTPRKAGRFHVPEGVKLVTYAARGFEATRGFDMFMRFAKALGRRRRDARFIVIGRDRVCYGGDLQRTNGMSYKEWVLAQDDYDLSRFAFVGPVSRQTLAEFFAITDLHVYWTVPFVLSWSLLNALACGAVVLASGTEPVCEVVEHERNGLLGDFFDPEGMAEQAARVLDDPAAFRPLGEAGLRLVREKYSLDACFPQLVRLFEEAAAGAGPPGSPEAKADGTIPTRAAATGPIP
jgi:glycosyltransferase involved in cell wall biosynthesis